MRDMKTKQELIVPRVGDISYINSIIRKNIKMMASGQLMAFCVWPTSYVRKNSKEK